MASIQAKSLETVKSPNVTNALAGKLPGLRAVQRSGAPGDDAASIDIRGFGSALVIVDGVERNFADIDANDIESISILKDASAAVYGFKGANGVILVKTKSGEKGKAKINYNGYFGIQRVTRYPDLYDAYEYATLYNEGQQNIGVKPAFSEDEIENFKKGIGCTDWYNETFRKNSPLMYHNVSVDGGNEGVKYYFSFGYLNQDGYYKSGDYNYKRWNVRSNISATIMKGLTVNLQLSGRLDERKRPYAVEPILRLVQNARPFNTIYANNNPNDYSYPGDNGNPIQRSHTSEVGYDNRDHKEFNGSLTVNWELPWVKGLSAKALFSYDYLKYGWKTWYKEMYAYQYDQNSDTYTVAEKHILSELTQYYKDYSKPNMQLSLNYTNTFGKHDIGALVLFEAYNDRGYDLKGYRQFDISAIDQLSAGNKTNMSSDGTEAKTAHEGLVGRLNYAYDNKYLFEFSFRYDGSYKFDPSSRWGFFPAVSLGWRISEEKFFKKALPMFDNMKIRASYGKVGDEGSLSAFQYLEGYIYPSGSYLLGSDGISNGAVDRGMPNHNLTWYKSKTANIGFEASAYRGLISMEFDYFVRKRDGLLATRLLSLPTTFGKSLPQENLNSDKTTGLELVLGHHNQINDFTYDVKANFSTMRNYYRHVERAESANMYENWRNNTNGRYQGIVWGYESIGQFRSYEEILNSPIQDSNGNKSLMPGDIKYRDLNNDGIIDSNDQKPIGHGVTPHIYYGLNLTGNYKNFDVTIFFQGAAGHEENFNGDFLYPFIQQGIGSGFDFWMDRWHRADASDMSSEWIPGKMPAIRPTGYANNAVTSTWSLQKAGYLRLKTLEIGYTFPKKWMHVVGIQNLRVYVNAFNLATFTSSGGLMKYMDPENSNGALRDYPQTKNFNFGLNLTI